MTATPGRIRSGQSWMAFGLPLRTRNTMVLVFGTAWSGSRSAQPGASRPRPASASMSDASARVTTSAGNPSSTARACAPEPPCEVWMLMRRLVCLSQNAVKAPPTSR